MIEPYRKKRENELLSDTGEQALLDYNLRFLKTYEKILGPKFKSDILDVGCGTDHFSKCCNLNGYKACGIDFDKCNFESDPLPYKDSSFNVITMNAVIEHIANPNNIMSESNRILSMGGSIIIRTPNWQMDMRNFYNDPTHVRPYTPLCVKTMLEMYKFRVVFLEPGLICKSNLYWKLPNGIRWRVASLIKGGTKSILVVGEKS